MGIALLVLVSLFIRTIIVLISLILFRIGRVFINRIRGRK
jgi:hypothetical protein